MVPNNKQRYKTRLYQDLNSLLECEKFHTDLSAPSATITASVRYAVWQFERGDNTGRLHVQAYVEFKAPVRIAGVKSLFGNTSIHCEKRMASAQQARDYCMKEDSRVEGKGPYEFGIFGGSQGKRNDLQDAAETLKKDGMLAVAKNHPAQFIKFHAGFKALEYTISTAESSAALRNVDGTLVHSLSNFH